jgi:hypothetical protein
MTLLPDGPQSFIPSFPPLAAFGGSPLYVTGEDALCATIFNAAAGVTVTITGRMLASGNARDAVRANDRPRDRSLGVGGPLPHRRRLAAKRASDRIEGTPRAGRPSRACRSCAARRATRSINSRSPRLRDREDADLVSGVRCPGIDRRRRRAALDHRRDAGAGAEISETVPTGARWELIADRGA